MHPFKVYGLVGFSRFAEYSHPHNLEFFYPLAVTLHSPIPTTLVPTDLLSTSMDLPIWKLLANGTIQYMTFCV